MKLGVVIATRSLSRGKSRRASAIVEIGKPRKTPGREEYQCPYRISGIDDDRVMVAYGVDAVQALQLAHRAIGAQLNSHPDLTWLGGETGFPSVDRRLPIEWARAIDLATYEPRGSGADARPWPPLEVLPSARPPKRVFLFTKSYLPHLWLKREAFPSLTDALVHFGIPSPRLCTLLRDYADRSGSPIRFVGDLDPLDLTVFAALKTGGAPLRSRRSRAVPVVYCGINDEWLPICERHLAWPRGRKNRSLRAVVIPIGQVERKQLAALQRAGLDIDGLVGLRCAGLLRSGFKLEIEGATNPRLYRPGLHRGLLDLLLRPVPRRPLTPSASPSR